MHFPMVVNWREKKECGHDAKEGTDKDSVYSSVPLKSVGLNLLLYVYLLLQILHVAPLFVLARVYLITRLLARGK